MSTLLTTKKSVIFYRNPRDFSPHILFFEGDLLDGITITAFAENPNKQSQEPYIEHNINIKEFKSYAQEKELFDWCMDYNEPGNPDGHGQLTGTMSWDEYCGQKQEAICHDLEKFLKHKSATQQKLNQ